MRVRVARIVGSVVGAVVGALVGTGTGIVGGPFGAMAGLAVFTIGGAIYGWSAGPDIADNLLGRLCRLGSKLLRR